VKFTHTFKTAFPVDILDRYEMREVRNAAAVIANTSGSEFDEILSVLGDFALTSEDVVREGGNEGTVAKRLNLAFRERGWREGQHDTKITSLLRLMPFKPANETKPVLVETEVVSLGYKVDNVKGEIALDVEWNAKDGNLDRDISAYRALYDAGIISAAVIVTRTRNDLRELGENLGRPDFLKTSTTTNLEKLEPRLGRGDTGGCPVLAVAITARCFEDADYRLT
jgi:hypothetical protein